MKKKRTNRSPTKNFLTRGKFFVGGIQTIYLCLYRQVHYLFDMLELTSDLIAVSPKKSVRSGLITLANRKRNTEAKLHFAQTSKKYDRQRYWEKLNE